MTTPPESEARSRSPRRGAKPVTVKRLEKAAANIARYDAISARLHTVPMRRVFKARRDDAPVVADVETVFDGIVARYAKAGVIGGPRYAERKAGSLHRRGVSTRHIREKLELARSERDSFEHAPGAARGELAVDAAGMDLQAALAFARRRRPDPFRAAAERCERRAKDLSVLGRASFAFDIARRVIVADDPDALIAQEAPS